MMRLVVVGLLLLVARSAGAICESRYNDNCRVLFSGGINTGNINMCTELATPTTPPPAGKQLWYCKPGVGLCSVDSSLTERCGSGTSGGGAPVISPTPPPSPSPGNLWWDTVSGNLFIYYFDGNSSQWVPAVATAAAASDIIRSSLAPFACGTGAAGMYDDVDCKQICVCAGSGSGNLWCRSDTGACGTNIDCCTPASSTTTSTTTTTTILLPVHNDSDANCPSTIPANTGSLTSALNQVRASETCVTGTNVAGYQVTAIFACINGGTVGTNVICSVYSLSGTTLTKVMAGCDTAQLTLPASPSGYFSVATTGTCTLAPSTRYWIACNTNANDLAYCSATGSNVGDARWTAATFPTLPTSWSASFNTSSYLSFYLTATPH